MTQCILRKKYKREKSPEIKKKKNVIIWKFAHKLVMRHFLNIGQV